MKKRKTSLALLLAGCAALGCSTEDKEPMTAAAYCEQRTTLECEKLASDCTLTPAATESCQAIRRQECVQETTALAQAAGRTFKEANAKRCLDETKKVFSALMPAAVWSNLRQVCNRVFEGAVLANQACAADLDCSEGLLCDKGVCGTSKVVASGAACSNPGEVCVAGQFCQRQPTSFWACVPRLAQGSACDGGNLCLESLRCGEANTCQPARGASEACVTDAECGATLVCEPTLRKCAASVNLSFQCTTFSNGGSMDAAAGG